MTNITVRIDETIKQEAEQLFDKLGFSISGAINVFLRQAIREQAIPFSIKANSPTDKYNEYFNPYNMNILMSSIEQIQKGQIIKKSIEDLEIMEND